MLILRLVIEFHNIDGLMNSILIAKPIKQAAYQLQNTVFTAVIMKKQLSLACWVKREIIKVEHVLMLF